MEKLNQRQLRSIFWRHHPQFRRRAGWTQNDYPTDVRVAWCDFVEKMHRQGSISNRVADRATL